MYASILAKGEQVSYEFEKGRLGYLHLVQVPGSSITINDKVLEPGDGAFIIQESGLTIKGVGDTPAEFVLMDLA